MTAVLVIIKCKTRIAMLGDYSRNYQYGECYEDISLDLCTDCNVHVYSDSYESVLLKVLFSSVDFNKSDLYRYINTVFFFKYICN